MNIPPMCEVKDFTTITDELVASYKAIVPTYVRNESDMIMPIIEAFAYREMLLRNQFNLQIKNSFWQTAENENLSFIANFFGISRLEFHYFEDDVEIVRYETDIDLRERIVLSFEGQNTAGSVNSYKYHTFKVSETIKDVAVYSDVLGTVTVVIGANDGISDDVRLAVETLLKSDTLKPLCEVVRVIKATQVIRNITANIKIASGADMVSTLENSKKRLEERVRKIRIGETLTLSMVMSNLLVEDVLDVEVVGFVPYITLKNEITKVENVELTIL